MASEVDHVARRRNEPKTPEEWIKRFIRAAEQRRDSAKRLEDASMFVDQMYLTGYVVECALKALIVNDASASDRRSALVDVTRGAAAHDFEHLRQIYRRRNRQFPIQGSRMLRNLITYEWAKALRYEVGRGDCEEASAFLKEASEFLEWVKGRL